MRYKSAAKVAMVSALATFLVASADAQDRPEHFGGNEGTTTIPAASFLGLPAPDSTGFSNYDYPGFPGGSVSGRAMLQLPNGAEITQLCMVANDGASNGHVILDLVGWEYPRVGTTTPTPARTLASASSAASVPVPGLGTYCAPLTTPIQLKSFGDLDGNTVPGWTAYSLRAALIYFPMGGVQPLVSQEAFGAAIVVWRRTVSPAPAVASFVDVPTTHPQFRFIQALVASGITGGCAADRFCPDSGISRGQFAVFISVALGLHYPN
jgi:hypothetical protein